MQTAYKCIHTPKSVRTLVNGCIVVGAYTTVITYACPCVLPQVSLQGPAQMLVNLPLHD